MKKVNVVDPVHLPSKLPVVFTMVTWLMLDRFHAMSTWIGGVTWCFVALVWAGSIIGLAFGKRTTPRWEE